MKLKKAIYIVLGCIGVGLGAVGAVLPLLPAFPFLLLAAFCFAKSSERLHNWFTGTKLYKNNLESYVKGKGMTWKTKIRIMVMVTLLMSIGFFLMSRVPIGQMVLTGVWVFHILYFVFGVKTITPEEMRKMAEEDASYAWCRKIRVEGMHCKDCAKRLECAFNQTGNMRAKVDYRSKTATVYMKESLNNSHLAQVVDRAGYRAAQIWEPAK